MKPIGLIGMGVLLLLSGAFTLTHAQQDETKPPKQEQQAKPEKQQPQQKQQQANANKQQQQHAQQQAQQEAKGQQDKQQKQQQQQQANTNKQQQQHAQQQAQQEAKGQQDKQQKQQQANANKQHQQHAQQQAEQEAKGQQGKQQKQQQQQANANKQQQQQAQQQAQQEAKGQQGKQQKQQYRPQPVKMQSQQAQRVQQSEQRGVWQERRAHDWQSEHRDWQQRGGYNGYRIPQDHYQSNFGPSHAFRIYSYPVIVVGGYPRFQYGGFWFGVVDPWPQYWSNDWYENDDVYVDYSDDGYYLHNRRYPQDRIAVSVYVNDAQHGVQLGVWQDYRAQHWQSEHRGWEQRGGYNGYRIPRDHYGSYFGPGRTFRMSHYPVMVVGGYPRFQYGGFSFTVVDPWPEYWSTDWYDTDDLYIDYTGDGYYLFNRRYPHDRLALNVSLN